MRCPACQHLDSKVVDSRTTGDSIRRRRECASCCQRFTTHERVEKKVVWVEKKNGSKEPFAQDKVLHGITLACRKRPVTVEQMQSMLTQVEEHLASLSSVRTTDVGDAVLELLKPLDFVAFVRFASVYREFESAEQFAEVLRSRQ